MKKLSMDIETRSSEDLKKVSVYRYAADPDFAVLWLSYSIDDGDVQTVDVLRDGLPDWLQGALENPDVEKHAYNAAFERVCLSAALLGPLTFFDPENWRCSLARAAEGGLSGSLDTVAKVLKSPVRKDPAGDTLIPFFSKPVKTKKLQGFRDPAEHPEKWEAYGAYNAVDVQVEMAVAERLPAMSAGEQRIYETDQRINDRGLLLDMQVVDGAVDLVNLAIEDGFEQIREITGVANPNSVTQVRAWLASQGYPMGSLDAAHVSAAIEDPEVPEAVVQYLRLRRATAMASVKKYAAAQRTVSTDDRLRGAFRFYGAHTGRWSGRFLQPQNLPRGGKYDAEQLRGAIVSRDRAALQAQGVSTVAALKDVIRTVIIPKPGHKFIAVDYSAIEAVVLAWLAGEERVLEVFRTHGKLYEANAATMFGLDFEQIENPSPERDKGKVATLACGFQGAIGAIKNMGGEGMGLTENDMLGLVRVYRDAHPQTVKFWNLMERAFISVMNGGTQRVHRLLFEGTPYGVSIQLPSGRKLWYPHAEMKRIEGRRKATFIGTESGRVGLHRVQTYGGKLTENVTQATGRDFQALALRRVEEAGFSVVLHVHDEVVVEVPEHVRLEDVQALIEKKPSWARDLPLSAAGFEANFYKKG